jgi:uncharacterized membrane protein
MFTDDDNNDNPIIIQPHVSKHNMRHVMIGLSLLSSSVITICGRIMIGLSLLSSSVNIICGGIMFGLLLLSSVSEHNMWSYYDWVVVVVVVSRKTTTTTQT